MSKLSAWEKRNKIRRGEPLEWNGLLLYPVTMSHYEEFLDVKNAWLARQSSFPVRYMAMPFLSAVWAMDVDFAKSDGKLIGLFERIIRFLYLSLRLEYNGEEAFKHIYCKNGEIRELSHIEVTQDGNTVTITPRDFAAYIRPLVAQQNGLELPDESYNPELVEAEQIMAEEAQKKSPLKYDTDTLLSSVAYVSGISEAELDEWTVLLFERRLRAIERDKNYMLYKQAELSGMVKFPKGNPCASWCYDTKSLSAAVIPLGDLQQKHSGIGDISGTVNASLDKGQAPQQQTKS